jgi:hypothetical protein
MEECAQQSHLSTATLGYTFVSPGTGELHEAPGLLKVETFTTFTRSLDPGDPEAWFWKNEWQAGELEAQHDIEAGRGIFHDSNEDFLASL